MRARCWLLAAGCVFLVGLAAVEPRAQEHDPTLSGLDLIQQTVLTEFHDPRVYLALGRGARGSGRLHSEAYTGVSLEKQLAAVAAECVTRAQCVQIDREANKVGAGAIFSWREKEFVA